MVQTFWLFPAMMRPLDMAIKNVLDPKQSLAPEPDQLGEPGGGVYISKFCVNHLLKR